MEINHLLTNNKQNALVPLEQALALIGFTAPQVFRLMQNNFTDCDYMLFAMLSKTDVTHLAETYAKRMLATIANAPAGQGAKCIDFGNKCITRMIGLMHLAQDHHRRGILPDFNSMLSVTLDMVVEALQDAHFQIIGFCNCFCA